MPVLTQEGEDGVVTAWMVDEGGSVRAGQLIAEVQVEKVAAEVEAPIDGVVRGLVAINQPVPQGRPICTIHEAETGETAPPASSPAPATVPLASDRPLASPAARRVAGELGVDLAVVTGSGPGGRITEADVVAAAGAAGAAVEMVGLRAVIARRMRESRATTAAVTLTSTVDFAAEPPQPITAAVVAAAAATLADHPALNGTRQGDLFLPAPTVHIALAIQTDQGLVAPVLRDPAARPVAELAEAIAALAERARQGELAAADFEGATFSVTNLGGYGVDGFTPLINPPQVAILGVGAIRTVPGFDAAGSVVPTRRMTLSLTFDHAFVDGAPAAAFLRDLGARLAGSSS